jgi:hypothetical protein
MCAVLFILMLTLAACAGGSGSASAADYDKSLDALCASQFAFLRDLPILQRTQHLSVSELSLRSSQRAAAFRSSVARLKPPSGLSAAARNLLTELNRGLASTPAEPTQLMITQLINHDRALLSDYNALGATGCAALQRQSIANLQALQKTP